MSAKIQIPDIVRAIGELAEPTVLRWNRLEGRPRSTDFQRAMHAEVRDAMWMLCRQWQLGEFEGEDCGSPVKARLHMRHSLLTDYAPQDAAMTPIDVRQPLEPRAERRAIALDAGAQAVALDIRLAIGRRWLAMISADITLAGYRTAYIRHFPVDPPELGSRQHGLLEAHREAAQMFAAAAGRCLDGGKLLTHLSSRTASDGLPGLSAGDQRALDALGPKLIDWYARVFDQPGAAEAWRPDRLEYAFRVNAAARPDAAQFKADEHHLGHIDWHSFDAAAAEPSDAPPQPGVTSTLLPTPIQFDGMPNTRWWRFEDGRVNFGDVKTDRVDLGRMLLVEFGLVYANDWFLIPIETPVGSISDVRGLTVTNTFGERIWIEAAGHGTGHGWRGWQMFTMSPAVAGGITTEDDGLLLPPSAVKILEGPPLEEVLLARDEMSNLVWGVERVVPLPHGEGKAGAETSAEMLAYQKRWFPAAPPIVRQADLRYELMSSVPEHWIPFVPTHTPDQERAIRLQRAVMLRAIDGDPLGPQKVLPRTSLLREGIDAAQPYFLFEEEVPRAGTRVTKAFRRTRARDGRVITWLATQKRTGRGESSSGLAFDRILPSP
jgi:hypothetical protein